MIRVNTSKLNLVRDILLALDEGQNLDLNDLARRVKQYGARYDPARSKQEIIDAVKSLAEALDLRAE